MSLPTVTDYQINYGKTQW